MLSYKIHDQVQYKSTKELENVSFFRETMDHMDMISRNSDNGSINLVDPRIPAAETS